MKTIEFRDGERDVPDHVAILMTGIRTWEMTYEEAKVRMNTSLIRTKLDRVQNDMVRQHLKKVRG